MKGEVQIPGLELPPALTLDRLNARRTLLGQLADETKRLERSAAMDRFDTFQARAFNMLTSSHSPHSLWRTFRVDEEKPQVQDRYGRNLYGHSTLLARRLVEAGVWFVTVTWEVFEKQGVDLDVWDTHQRNFPS